MDTADVVGLSVITAIGAYLRINAALVSTVGETAVNMEDDTHCTFFLDNICVIIVIYLLQVPVYVSYPDSDVF